MSEPGETSSLPAVPEVLDAPVETVEPAARTLPQAEEMPRFGKRFLLLYGALAGILVAAVAGFVVLNVHPSIGGGSNNWSTWKPKHGTTADMAKQIADHVASQYHLNKKGNQLVAVVSGPPQVQNGTHKVSISNIAVRTNGASSSNGIQIIPSGSIWTDQLCGLAPGCSIASGKPTELRGRLVRREALEVALYTFKYVPAIKSIVAFMPPPSGTSKTSLLYLQKENFARELSQPLTKTLPLAKPPLPTSEDTSEAATIDRLTTPAIYTYSLQQLQDASALLVLNPFKT